MIHGGKMHSEKEGMKPVAVAALQTIVGTREPCKPTKITGLNLGV